MACRLIESVAVNPYMPIDGTFQELQKRCIFQTQKTLATWEILSTLFFILCFSCCHLSLSTMLVILYFPSVVKLASVQHYSCFCTSLLVNKEQRDNDIRRFLNFSFEIYIFNLHVPFFNWQKQITCRKVGFITYRNTLVVRLQLKYVRYNSYI